MTTAALAALAGGNLRGRAVLAAATAFAAGSLALASQLDAAQRGRPHEVREVGVEGRVRSVTVGPGWTQIELGSVSPVALPDPPPPCS